MHLNSEHIYTIIYGESMRTIVVSTLLSFACMSLFAMDNQRGKTYSRNEWGACEARSDVSARSEDVVRIVIGHTVTDLGDPILTLQRIQKTQMDLNGDFKFSDIYCNDALDSCGNRYRCREKNQLPTMVAGKNRGSCCIGCIGRFDQNEVSVEMARGWGLKIAEIAVEYNLKKLERGVNIFGMSELAPKEYPSSPGKLFMAKFDFIVEVANKEIARLNEQCRF